ncbi:OpgC family protein [Geminicoccus roseus]|uniref:OpgC family protein n=1 Tax=Geminicoccus roseus TaxID=404900 RepID=UPI0004289190|nr:OpgC domain-containing protein [Geminicoccus roseus]
MRRLELLDGLRGYFLVFMMLNHLYFTGGLTLVHVNHAELGFVEDAQGFVFLSGLLIGMVYAKRMAREGFAAGAVRIWHRAAELYLYALLCLFVVLLAVRLMPELEAYWANWLGELASPGHASTLAAATLVHQPTYMDILPQYIAYLLVAPPLVYLVLRDRWMLVAIASAVLWLAVQLGLHLPLGNALDHLLGQVEPGLAMRNHFNVFAWQVVFMAGLVMGALSATHRIDWKKVFHPSSRSMLLAAVVFFSFFMAFRLGWTFGVIPEASWDRFVAITNRGEFSLVYLLNFVATGYLLAWLLIAGPWAEENWIRQVAAVLTSLFSLPFLRLIGRHSLQVYVFHVVVVYAMLAVDRHLGPFPESVRTLLAITAIASLAIPAWLREADLRGTRQAAMPTTRGAS